MHHHQHRSSSESVELENTMTEAEPLKDPVCGMTVSLHGLAQVPGLTHIRFDGFAFSADRNIWLDRSLCA